ncbi:MAG: hypothetical protein JWR80_4469 [Bradyrhizobium sp.]|nr:hypothetical protein [Bradyrhizobium sp.]
MPIPTTASGRHHRSTPPSSHGRRHWPRLSCLILIGFAATAPAPTLANNYGESLAWQFKTSSDRANQAAVLDLIQKQRGGYYAAPTYNTNIARQYNCSIAATATGNSGAQKCARSCLETIRCTTRRIASGVASTSPKNRTSPPRSPSAMAIALRAFATSIPMKTSV